MDLRVGKLVLVQPFFFLVRRLMIAIAIVIVNQVLIWQIMLMASQIVASVIIIGNVRPYRHPSKRKIEIFNEIILMVVMYTIICFSDLVPNIEARFTIGYVCMATISTHLGVNFIIIGKTTYNKIRMKILLRLAIRRYKKER